MTAQLASSEDAFGSMLLDHLGGRAVTAWLESDDGRSQPALGPDVFFASEDEWPATERDELAFVSGRVLDIGCGAGRHALRLQEAGFEVVAIDVSPGAVDVARRRGVHDVRQLAAEEVDAALGRFDGFLMMCGNFGLVGSAEGGATCWCALRRLPIRAPRSLPTASTMPPFACATSIG